MFTSCNGGPRPQASRTPTARLAGQDRRAEGLESLRQTVLADVVRLRLKQMLTRALRTSRSTMISASSACRLLRSSNEFSVPASELRIVVYVDCHGILDSFIRGWLFLSNQFSRSQRAAVRKCLRLFYQRKPRDDVLPKGSNHDEDFLRSRRDQLIDTRPSSRSVGRR
jgi:hypothetical protein